MTIARVALPVATAQLFDYWVPAGLEPRCGAIVRVPLGRRHLVGVVAELLDESSVARDKLVPIDEIVALPPLPDDVRELVQFVASYYQAPLGLAYALATPPAGASSARTRGVARALALTDAGRAALPTALEAWIPLVVIVPIALVRWLWLVELQRFYARGEMA